MRRRTRTVAKRSRPATSSIPSFIQLEKTIKDTGDKISADVKSKIEAGVVSAKKDLESNEVARMRSAIENLTKLGGEIYAQAQQAAAAAGAGGGAAPGGEPAPEGEKKKSDQKST